MRSKPRKKLVKKSNMGIKEDKKGIKKGQTINFTWTIKDYALGTRYTNKIECGKTIIKILMEPCYVKGKVEGASPFIMFDDVEGSDEKEFKLVIKTGFNKFESTYGFIPLKLKYKYDVTPRMFFEAFNYVRYLDLRKHLTIHFELLIAGKEYEIEADFDGSKYSSDLQNLFDNKSFCDCEFQVNGSVINGHKFILSTRAPALAKAIEDGGNKLAINDCSTEGFNEFMRYLYCERIADKRDEILFDVLSLAHAYNVGYVKDFCEMIFKNNLSVLNANAVYQNAHKYELSEDMKRTSFALIQIMFKKINQKLPDEFMNDPKYVDNLITIAENLINGLKKKELQSEEAAFVSASPSVKQMKVESAINDIYKEAEKLNDEDQQIETAEPTKEFVAHDEPNDMIEFSSMDNYVNNMNECLAESDYEEFAENIAAVKNDRYLDIIIEEDVFVPSANSEETECDQAVLDSSDTNKTFDIGNETLEMIQESPDALNVQKESTEEIKLAEMSDEKPELSEIDENAAKEMDQAQESITVDEIAEIQKDIQDIGKFIIQVTNEVGQVVECINSSLDDVDVVMEECSPNVQKETDDNAADKSDESCPIAARQIKINIQIVEEPDDPDDLKILNEILGDADGVEQKQN